MNADRLDISEFYDSSIASLVISQSKLQVMMSSGCDGIRANMDLFALVLKNFKKYGTVPLIEKSISDTQTKFLR
jgi:hypothetical protein